MFSAYKFSLTSVNFYKRFVCITGASSSYDIFLSLVLQSIIKLHSKRSGNSYFHFLEYTLKSCHVIQVAYNIHILYVSIYLATPKLILAMRKDTVFLY